MPLAKIKRFANTQGYPTHTKLYNPRRKNILTSLVSPMQVLISWGMGDNNNNGFLIDTNSGCGGVGGSVLPAAAAVLTAGRTCW